VRNIKLILEYDGTDFAGWQVQGQGERTVQDVLRAAIVSVTGEDSQVVASGRTDSGVHAIRQVAAFETGSGLDPSTLKRALNANLPGDVRVKGAEEASGGFHPIRDALGKRYVYLMANMEHVSPFVSRYVWHLPGGLDLKAMKEATLEFQGRRDFASLMATGSDVKDTVREVRLSRLVESEGLGFLGFELKGRFLRLQVEGDGFLRHMVRNIAGTVAEVGRGRLSAEDIPDLLEARDRDAAGPTAPACGLFLESVEY
jgi:tRNA pseudouridine38-40 synthase